MDDRERLIAAIVALCAKRLISEATFGLLAVNDGKFCRRLRAGANVTTATLSKAANYIAAPGSETVPARRARYASAASHSAAPAGAEAPV